MLGACLVLGLVVQGILIYLPTAEGPRDRRGEPAPVAHQTAAGVPLDDQVRSAIRDRFGPAAESALTVADCESLLLRKGAQYAVGATYTNDDGSTDHGVFQINGIHRRRFGDGFTRDWRENVRVAHLLYVEQGWGPWYSSARCHRLTAASM